MTDWLIRENGQSGYAVRRPMGRSFILSYRPARGGHRFDAPDSLLEYDKRNAF